MRWWFVPAAALVAACSTTVRDLPPDFEADARIAATMDFSGSRIDTLLRVRSDAGREFVLRPEGRTFVMALPAGRYEILNFGNYRPTEDRLSFTTRKGATTYIGAFVAGRDRDGDLRIAIRDESAAARAELAERYPELTIDTALTRSSLQPLEPDQPVVVAVEEIETPVHVGFGVGYYGMYGYPYRGRYRRYRHRVYGGRYYCP